MNTSQNIVIQTDSQDKKKYDDINYQQRRQLIQLIEQQKCTIKKAASKMGIKLCTAKHIIYLYRKTGKIYKKKTQHQEQKSVLAQSNNNIGNINKDQLQLENRQQQQQQMNLPFLLVPVPVDSLDFFLLSQLLQLSHQFGMA